MIHLLRIETGHRPAVETKGPSSQNQIGALRRAVSERRALDQVLLTFEDRRRILVMREQL